MSEWVRAALDLVLIAMVGAGLIQAGRLIKQLVGLHKGRLEMEQFVREFSATVYRAEAGIKALKTASRETGDDLEKLVEKGVMIRDELHFLIESADQIAERLSGAASHAVKPGDKVPGAREMSPPSAPITEPKPAANVAEAKPAAAPAQAAPAPSSRAEKELLQALQKLS